MLITMAKAGTKGTPGALNGTGGGGDGVAVAVDDGGINVIVVAGLNCVFSYSQS